MVMVGHISAPELTGGDNVPSSLSESVITGILRGQLGYLRNYYHRRIEYGSYNRILKLHVWRKMTLKAGAGIWACVGRFCSGI